MGKTRTLPARRPPDGMCAADPTSLQTLQTSVHTYNNFPASSVWQKPLAERSEWYWQRMTLFQYGITSFVFSATADRRSRRHSALKRYQAETGSAQSRRVGFIKMRTRMYPATRIPAGNQPSLPYRQPKLMSAPAQRQSPPRHDRSDRSASLWRRGKRSVRPAEISLRVRRKGPGSNTAAGPGDMHRPGRCSSPIQEALSGHARWDGRIRCVANK